MRTTSPCLIAAGFVAVLATGPALAMPQAVSPGDGHDFVASAGACPSFNWAGIADQHDVELAIFRVDETGHLDPVLAERLPAGARGWSPAADQCLAAGGRYAWMVRGRSIEGAGEWSEARLFEVSGMPSDEDVRQAMETLGRYREGAEKDGRAGDVGEGLAPSRSPDAGLPTTDTSGTEARRYRLGGEALSVPTVSETPSPQLVTPPASFSLNLSGDLSLGGAGKIFLSGVPFIHNDKGAGSTAVGWDALISATPGVPNAASGILNTALGHTALTNTTEGSANTAVGHSSLTANTTGSDNTALGSMALFANDAAYANTAIGADALRSIQQGPYAGTYLSSQNTAVGHGAMRDTGYGFENVAVGTEALSASGNGTLNVAVGHQALLENLAGGNTAVGHRALASNTVGAHNVAVGEGSLQANINSSSNTAVGRTALYHTTGYNNIGIGAGAGFSLTTGDHNIAIGVNGVAGESSTTRIGNPVVAGKTFIAGIQGVTTDVNDAVAVMIDSAGQLGTISSSARFKEDIHDLGQLSARVTELRPVAFRYRKPFAGGAKPIQFGLIAEEVAEVFPELVVYDEDGRPETVKYHLLATLLLNEVQRQHDALSTLDNLNQEISDLRTLLSERGRKHQRAIADLERRLDGLATRKRFRR